MILPVLLIGPVQFCRAFVVSETKALQDEAAGAHTAPESGGSGGCSPAALAFFKLECHSTRWYIRCMVKDGAFVEVIDEKAK
jgi:hypothetical protein